MPPICDNNLSLSLADHFLSLTYSLYSLDYSSLTIAVSAFLQTLNFLRFPAVAPLLLGISFHSRKFRKMFKRQPKSQIFFFLIFHKFFTRKIPQKFISFMKDSFEIFFSLIHIFRHFLFFQNHKKNLEIILILFLKFFKYNFFFFCRKNYEENASRANENRGSTEEMRKIEGK